MANNTKKIIRIRKGINGFPFSICNEKGNWIANIHSTKEAYDLYRYETKHGILKTMHITLIIAGRLNCYHADFIVWNGWSHYCHVLTKAASVLYPLPIQYNSRHLRDIM